MHDPGMDELAEMKVETPIVGARHMRLRPVPGLDSRELRVFASEDGKIVVQRDGRYRVLAPYWARTKRGAGQAYLRVDIKDGEVRRRIRVHVAVCLAWRGEAPFEGAMVRHLDDNRANCAAFNLAWGSARDNAQDARDNRAAMMEAA